MKTLWRRKHTTTRTQQQMQPKATPSKIEQTRKRTDQLKANSKLNFPPPSPPFFSYQQPTAFLIPLSLQLSLPFPPSPPAQKKKKKEKKKGSKWIHRRSQLITDWKSPTEYRWWPLALLPSFLWPFSASLHMSLLNKFPSILKSGRGDKHTKCDTTGLCVCWVYHAR